MTFLLCKSMLTTPIHFLVLHVFGNVFQDYLPLHFLRDWCEVDQSVAFQFLLLVLLDHSDICFLPVLRNLHLHNLSKMTKSSLTMTLASSLNTHECILSGP